MTAQQQYLQFLSDAPDAGVVVWMEKRRSARVRYSADVPINNAVDSLPDDSTFKTVEACDLSQNGIAFHSHDAPDEPHLVIQLGEDSDAIYLQARVVRCEKDYDDPERRFIVGCEFGARM